MLGHPLELKGSMTWASKWKMLSPTIYSEE